MAGKWRESGVKVGGGGGGGEGNFDEDYGGYV